MSSVGDGLRAWKSDASGRTYYLYDGSDPVCELDANGTLQAVNTFGAQGLVSRHTVATGASVFYAFDERGNVAQRLDAGGSALSADLYDAFGARTGTAPPGTGATGDPWGFGAQWGDQTDNETGLVLCTNRFYDPQQGRFLTRDPMGYDGGVNLYGYTQNNPVNHSDPTGYSLSSGSSGFNGRTISLGFGKCFYPDAFSECMSKHAGGIHSDAKKPFMDGESIANMALDCTLHSHSEAAFIQCMITKLLTSGFLKAGVRTIASAFTCLKNSVGPCPSPIFQKPDKNPTTLFGDPGKGFSGCYAPIWSSSPVFGY